MSGGGGNHDTFQIPTQKTVGHGGTRRRGQSGGASRREAEKKGRDTRFSIPTQVVQAAGKTIQGKSRALKCVSASRAVRVSRPNDQVASASAPRIKFSSIQCEAKSAVRHDRHHREIRKPSRATDCPHTATSDRPNHHRRLGSCSRTVKSCQRRWRQ